MVFLTENMFFLPFGDIFLIASELFDNNGLLTTAPRMVPLQVLKLLIILEFSRSGIDVVVRQTGKSHMG